MTSKERKKVTNEVAGEKIQISFMDEIREQPDALRRFVEYAFGEEELQHALDRLVKPRKNLHVVLTGMGSSLFVCYIAMKFLRDRGILASVVESYELQKMEEQFFSDGIIVIAVSQSGESPEVLELIKKMPKEVPVIGVSNYFNSHLCENVAVTGGIYAGMEYRTSTKSYTNSLAAMILLAHRILGYSGEEFLSLSRRLEQCADKMEGLIGNEKIGKDIAEFICDIEFLIFIGSGYSYTTASHSEIVAEEAGKFHSSRFTPAQFIHGPIELIGEKFGVVVYDFDRHYSSKCDCVRENVLKYGGKVMLITNRVDVEMQENQMVCVVEHEDPVTATLLEIIPLELGINSLCENRGVAAGCLTRVVKRMGN